ncbi:Esterase LovG [Diplonema papillatum]|nr:Esterase LovG [Diplonema papillatum]
MRWRRWAIPMLLIFSALPMLLSDSSQDAALDVLAAPAEKSKDASKKLVLPLAAVLVAMGLCCYYALNSVDEHSNAPPQTPMVVFNELDENRPLHLVCLHGYLSSAAFMEMQLHTLGISEPNTIVTCLDGPHESGESFFTRHVSKGDETYYYWFDFKDTTTAGDATKWLIEKLLEIVSTSRRPIDGLVGFSQGACICTDAMSTISAWRENFVSLPGSVRSYLPLLPQFSVLVSAVCPEAVLQDKYDWYDFDYHRSLPIRVPSLHVVGRSDEYREESDGIYDLYDDSMATYVEHAGGHDIDSRVADLVNEDIAMWLNETGRVAAGLQYRE